jgi:ParB family chromosome partitioning protein
MKDTQSRTPIQCLAVDTLQPFKNHPFRMYSREKLAELSESIRENGVISPILVRPLASGGYEIVSGHNRVEACKLSGIETIPAIVRDMDDDTAILVMIDANQQRETVLPSEKAFAYKMRLEAMKRQGKRTASVGTQVGYKSGEKSADRLARDVGESRNQIQRYIRLTYLISELRDMVDSGKLAMNPAV